MKNASIIILFVLLGCLHSGCNNKEQNKVKEAAVSAKGGPAKTSVIKSDVMDSLALKKDKPKDSVYISYSPSGEVFLKEFYYPDGSRKVIAYKGERIKAESNFFVNGKVHFKKYSSEGEIAMEHIKKDGVLVFDTIYWDRMEMD